MPDPLAFAEPRKQNQVAPEGRALISLCLLPLIFAFLWCVVSMLMDPHRYPIDDAYFYLVIAHNFAHGMGSTFNGLTTTNGYHPLWMLLIALVSRLSPLGKGGLIFEVTALQFALMLVGCAAILRIFKKSLLLSALSIALYETIFLGKGTLSLMEIWLAAPLLLVSVVQLIRLDEGHGSARRTRWILGVCLAAASLARLEIGFTSGLMWLAAIWITRRGKDPKHPAAWYRSIAECFPPMMLTPILVGAYLLLNRHFFGSAMPISGRIKSSFPHPHIQLGGPLGVLLLTALLLGFAAAAVSRRRGSSTLPPSALALSLTALGGGLTISLTYDILFSGPTQWYFPEGYCYLILGFPLFIRALFKARAAVYVSLIMLLAVATCTLNYLRRSTNFFLNPFLIRQAGTFHAISEQPDYLVSLELNKILPPRSGLLIRDAPGVVAYFTDLRVFPADGLVASTAYSKEVVRTGALRYFCDLGVHWVLSPEPEPGHPYIGGVMDVVRQNGLVTYRIYSPLGERFAGEWTVPDQPVRIFPEISPQMHTSFPHVALRQIPCPVDEH